MTKFEIMQIVANNHNRLAQIMVNGDNAIMMGDTIKELRSLVLELQKDIDSEQSDEVSEDGKS